MKRRFTILTAALALLTFLAVPMGMRGQTTVTWPGTSALPGTATAVANDQNVTIKTSSTNTYTNPIRIYANTTVTINALNGAKILSVAYEASSTGDYVTNAQNATVSPNVTPTVSNKIVTWTYAESANVTVFTFKPSAQTRSNGISITYKTSSGGTTYTVTFDAGEGTFVGNTDFPNASNSLAAGTYTLPSATPATGYTFDGWVATGITTPITGSYTVSGAVAFTAHYTQSGSSGQIATLTASNLELTGSYTTNTEKTIDGIKYVYTDLMLSSERIQAKASSGTIRNTTAYSEDIVSVAITHSGTGRETTIWGSANGENWTSVATGSGSITADFSGKGYKYFKITRGSNNAAYWTQIVITCEAASSVAKPTFNPAGGIYTSAQSVTISAESGVNIYYTTDGSQPTTNSTQYNGAISIESTTTLKAIAVVNGESSNVTSATYTIVTPLTTMQAIFDNATANPASHEVAITFGNWVVSGQNGSQTTGSGAQKAWLTDNNGNGCLIYDSNNPGLMANNVLNGTVICNLQLYNGSAQITGVNSATTDINGNTIVSTGGAITPVETTIGNLSGVSTGAVVKLNHLRCVSAGTTSNTLTDGTNTIYAKKTLYSSLSFEEGKIYDLTGVFEYSSSTSTIYPRSTADVVEAPKATLAIGTLTNVTGLNVFYVYDEYNPIISEGQSSAQQQVYVGEEIKVSPEVAAHCAMQSLTVTDGNSNPITVTDHMTDGGYYSFIMPSSGASITATASVAQQYTLTVVGDHVSITQLLVGEESDIVSLDANNQALIYEQAEVEVDGLTVDAAFMIESVTIEYGNTSLEVTKNDGGLYAFTMPSSDATLTFTTTTAPTYTLANSIESGKTYIIVGFNGDDAYAMAEQKNNNRAGVSITFDGSTATGNADVHEVVITALEGDDDGKYTIEDGGFLYAASSSDNYLKTEATLDDNGKWTIVIDENGDATITAQGSNTRKLMRFNPSNGNPLFACYKETSTTGSLPRLYVKDEPATESYTLTINAHTTNGGWYLIASPVAVNPANVEGMTIENSEDPNYSNFDLYYFDQTGGQNGKEWKNYKASHFDLELGKGYLYANANTVDLTFTGIENGDFTDVDLPYVQGNTIQSLYLAGNSKTTTETFYVYDGENQITFNYLVMNEDGNGFTTGQDTYFEAQPLQGFFVQAPKANTTLSTTNESDADGVSLLNVQVMRNRGTVVDNAIVSFSNGPTMKKFQLFENSTKLYIPQDNEDYAIVRSEAQGELPVSFRASENGTYTLSMNVENVDMNYLHLIDNMTGMDVDLLQTPSYTFEANTNDYANRFKLVFAANGTDEADESSFAFFSNGNLIVNNEGNATLQVIDINGRILSSETISGSCSKAINATTGVYMLRLINGDNVKVQKVVVR